MDEVSSDSEHSSYCFVPDEESSVDFDESVDRISTLDDDILLHILSYLPTVDAVRTGVYSKRWLYLWTLVPCLNFEPFNLKNGSRIRDRDFCSFVNKTLLFHKCQNIRKFRLSFIGNVPSHVYSWIRFATLANVEELDLEICCCLPVHLYANSTLKRLRLNSCIFQPHRRIDWRSLKVLLIQSCNVSQDFINNLLSGTPVLEALVFFQVCGLDSLHITSSALKKLVIIDEGACPINDHGHDHKPLKIEAPYLHSLSIRGQLGKPIETLNVSSLVSATLDFLLDGFPELPSSYKYCKNMFLKMMQRLCHVTDLRLGCWLICCLPKLNEKKLSMPKLKCKRLALNTEVLFRDFSRIAALLYSACEVEELTIDMTSMECVRRRDKFASKSFWTSCENKFTCLKTVTIMRSSQVSFQKEPLLALLQFLLKEACVLEKVVFEAPNAVDPQTISSMRRDSHQMGKKLLSFPTSSPKVVILIS